MTMTMKTLWPVILVVVTCAGSGRFAAAGLVTGTPTMMPVPPNSWYLDFSPDVSSNNLELYFGSNRPGTFGPWSTWVARRDSLSDAFGVPEAVTSLNHPSISSDGLSLYGTGGGDNESLDLFVVTRPSTDGPWNEPVNLGSSINTAQDENGCHISADGLEFYFSREWAEANSSEIWVAKRSDTSEPFGDAVKLPPIINEPRGTWSPEISDDGLTLVFAASRPDGFGLEDLWASTRPTKDGDWGEPVNLGPDVNTAFFEGTADISPDGRTLYFARTVSTDLWENWDLWQVRLFVPGERFTTTRQPRAVYVVKDNDSDSTFDNSGDSVGSSKSALAAAIGERDTPDSNAIVRLVEKFELPQVPEVARRLERATLRLFLEDTAGTPAGPVSLFHSVDDNDVDESPSDFEETSYEDTLLDLVQPTGPGQMYYELDVTNLVLRDYESDGGHPLSAFRLQVNETVFLEDDQSHRYRFTMPGAGTNPPELVLTFIPEPSTLILCILALGVVGGWRKGRG